MRIIAGRFKGHRIVSPRGSKVRPTTERVREAMFSHIGDAVRGVRILELFAGTGAFGFEALSRGARSVVFVENDPATARQARRVAESLGAEAEVSILELDARVAVQILTRKKERFGIVFLDPPYESDWITQLVVSPGLPDLVERGGLLVWERQARSVDLPLPSRLERRFSRRYGNTLVEMFEVNPQPPF
ncbi:MAG: 16S rRNA (guanine(966)-N(2))-methyltransferase RsmD [Thermodesulfobacteriota bacterium]